MSFSIIQQFDLRSKLYAALALVTVVLFCSSASVAAGSKLIEAEEARPPFGYMQFCSQFPAECEAKAENRRVSYTVKAFRELSLVNKMVNEAIVAVTDQDLYGVQELWTYPADSGDCEDFVLLKRRVLIDRGWPEEALMITVVRQSNGEGHSVLTVATDQGDYVLDNIQQGVKLWSETPYEYVKRQSLRNSSRWVWLDVDTNG